MAYDNSRRADLFRNIQKTETCWLWLNKPQAGGYGYTGAGWRKNKGQTCLAHRAVYILIKGPIPDGMVLDHLCRNKICVNPDHLEPVTRKENTYRCEYAPATINLQKTHCINGHELSGANLRISKQTSERVCRACGRAKTTRWMKANSDKRKSYKREYCQREHVKQYRAEYGRQYRARLKAIRASRSTAAIPS